MADGSIPLEKAIEEFLESPTAHIGMRSDLMRLARLVGKDCPMFALSSREVKECAKEVKKAAERKKRVEALESFLGYAKEKGWIPVDLAAGLAKKKEPRIQRKTTPPERRGPILLSQEGRSKVESEIEELFREKARVTAEVAAAREEGDLSENAGYHDARERLALIDAQLREKEALLAQARTLE